MVSGGASLVGGPGTPPASTCAAVSPGPSAMLAVGHNTFQTGARWFVVVKKSEKLSKSQSKKIVALPPGVCVVSVCVAVFRDARGWHGRMCVACLYHLLYKTGGKKLRRRKIKGIQNLDLVASPPNTTEH